jgi:hypothetical protein
LRSSSRPTLKVSIDQYNQTIVDRVRDARVAGHDWLVLDTCGLLDRVATRRYVEDPSARPSWWTPYRLPAPLARLVPAVDSQFFGAGPSGRTQGGLFALDGMHPTTVGYGILAEECIKVMAGSAHVTFPGASMPTGTGTRIDFNALLARDTLMSDPPEAIGEDLKVLAWLNEVFEWGKRLAALGHDLL